MRFRHLAFLFAGVAVLTITPVSKLGWANPHTLIQLDAASTVKLLKAKDGSNTGAWREVTFPPGTRKSATAAR